jgi:hypothetical protein
MNINTPIRGN